MLHDTVAAARQCQTDFRVYCGKEAHSKRDTAGNRGRGAQMSNELPCQLPSISGPIIRDVARNLRRGAPTSNRLPCVKSTSVLRGNANVKPTSAPIAVGKPSDSTRYITESLGRGAPMSSQFPCLLSSVRGPIIREILHGTWGAERCCQTDFRVDCRRYLVQ